MLRLIVPSFLILLLSSCVQTPPRTSDLPSGVKAIHVNGYDMAFVERGTGQPVVLVHGALSDFRYFGGAMESLSEKYRVIAVTLRHYYPERWDGKGGNFAMRQHVSDVAAFIRVLKLVPVHLVGHLRGGSLALYVASAYPELVRTLTIAEGGGNIPEFEGSDPSAGAAGLHPRQRNTKVVTMFEAGKIDEGLAYFIDDVVGPGAWKATPEPVREMFRDNAWTVKGTATDSYDPYTCADARRIAAPVLLIGGEKSPPRFGKILNALQHCLTSAQRVTISNASHDMPRQNPKAFSEAVATFISKH